MVIFTRVFDYTYYSSGSGYGTQAVDSADKLLSGLFCFVQTEEGKIVAVHHSMEDHPSAVNIKKGIASAFQANFKQTDTEEEIDPQSIHIAHYRYISSYMSNARVHAVLLVYSCLLYSQIYTQEKFIFIERNCYNNYCYGT